MNRRDVLVGIGGAASLLSITTWAQQKATPVIGLLSSVSAAQASHLLTAFREGLNQSGYSEGVNLAIEYRWAEGRYEHLTTLANELLQHKVAALVAFGGPPVAAAAKAATSSVPIVFLTGDEPVRAGLVQSLNRPGGNATGVSMFSTSIWSKRLQLLKDLVPQVRTIAVLVNSRDPNTDPTIEEQEVAAGGLGCRLITINANTEDQIEPALRSVQGHAAALTVSSDPMFTNRRTQIVQIISQLGLPAIYQWREYVGAGGLISYGPNLTDCARLLGVYAGRIVKGEEPAVMPVMQPTRLTLAINLKTATALGLTVPQLLLAQADEVIE